MFWAAIAVICVASYWAKVEQTKIRRTGGGDLRDLKREVKRLKDENEDLREELQEIKYLLGTGKDSESINLTSYEQEQIRLDNQNKFKY